VEAAQIKTFDLAGFAMHLAKLPLIIAIEQHEAMEEACRVVEDEAKQSIGHYQAAAGPFAAWAPLADTTLQGWGGHPGKIALGYAPPDNPELRTGDLRDSIKHQAEQGVVIGGAEGAIGSDEDNMVWQEIGTSKMPARSILGGAAVRKADVVAELLGRAAVMALVGAGQTTRIP
jgi:hypothetical protein